VTGEGPRILTPWYLDEADARRREAPAETA
jgi:hypothetical protein